MRRFLLPVLAALAGATPAAAQGIDTLAIRGHTRFLAHDLLAGRGTGTEGEAVAAAYVASQLERLGLSPLPGAAGYKLPVPLGAAIIDPASALILRTDRDSTVFRYGTDFIFNTGAAPAFRGFAGDLVYFGDPADALARIAAEPTMHGRVAVFAGPLGAPALEIVPALEAAGTRGVILLVPDADAYDLFVRSRGPRRYFVDAPVDDPVWQPDLPVLLAGPELTAALLDGVSPPPESWSRGRDLRRSVDARVAVQLEALSAANVAAVLPGSDPALRDEYLVYTAHYDHLGISAPDVSGDSIYNGFSDNAAGVAMLLAIAEALRDSPPGRSVAFLFLTAEERGLLGSSHLAAGGILPLQRVVALINLDAGAPPAPPVSWRIAGGLSALGEIAREVAEERGWTASLGAAGPNSDHWPFLQRGVPAIFIIPGSEWEDTSPEEREALRRRWDRYHLPADHWNADFPFAGLGRYAEYALLVGLRAVTK
ncbi:MAG TPA: M20/M25/M40 family metallo-hydrolase [Longimicrobiales bacterium]|nr:M20/M25/M40 family metallo-hydrolase [Longimicrobiales bacterium]